MKVLMKKIPIWIALVLMAIMVSSTAMAAFVMAQKIKADLIIEEVSLGKGVVVFSDSSCLDVLRSIDLGRQGKSTEFDSPRFWIKNVDTSSIQFLWNASDIPNGVSIMLVYIQLPSGEHFNIPMNYLAFSDGTYVPQLAREFYFHVIVSDYADVGHYKFNFVFWSFNV